MDQSNSKMNAELQSSISKMLEIVDFTDNQTYVSSMDYLFNKKFLTLVIPLDKKKIQLKMLTTQERHSMSISLLNENADSIDCSIECGLNSSTVLNHEQQIHSVFCENLLKLPKKTKINKNNFKFNTFATNVLNKYDMNYYNYVEGICFIVFDDFTKETRDLAINMVEDIFIK